MTVQSIHSISNESAHAGTNKVHCHRNAYVLSGFPGMLSGQWAYEARQAKQIACRRSLRRLFPMTTPEEIHHDIRPRR